MRVTPEQISTLEDNEIFVFGSNESGIHGAGAARFAYDNFGAFYEQGFGLMGQSFGIPTKDWFITKLDIQVVKFYVDRFIDFAKKSKQYTFYVTKIGCGLAGFTEEEIAPLFSELIDDENVYLPVEFITIINK